MADEQPDDKMTVRERRAAHAKAEARKGAPVKFARKALVPGLVVLLLAAIATGFYFENKNSEDCPGHFHGTFAIYIPTDNGTPEPVDFGTPKAANGGHYYDLQNRNSGMSISVHMHQSGSEAFGLGPSQLHFEAPGKCVPLEDAFSALEVEVSDSRLRLHGAHEQAGQDGTWREEGNQTLGIYLQSEKDGEWVWEKTSVKRMDGRQLQDGESFLIAFGAYTDEQIRTMQESIPAPISRDTSSATQASANGASGTGLAFLALALSAAVALARGR